MPPRDLTEMGGTGHVPWKSSSKAGGGTGMGSGKGPGDQRVEELKEGNY